MSTSSGVGSQDSGEPNECDTKDGEKVHIIDFDRILYSLALNILLRGIHICIL